MCTAELEAPPVSRPLLRADDRMTNMLDGSSSIRCSTMPRNLPCATVVRADVATAFRRGTPTRRFCARLCLVHCLPHFDYHTPRRVGSPNARRSEPLDSLVGHRNPGVHNGPMKRSGGIRGQDYTPTIDGNFDRISFEIEPSFGTEEDFVAMGRTARPTTRWSSTTSFPRTPARAPTFDSRKSAMENTQALSHGLHRGGRLGLLPPVPPGREASISLRPRSIS